MNVPKFTADAAVTKCAQYYASIVSSHADVNTVLAQLVCIPYGPGEWICGEGDGAGGDGGGGDGGGGGGGEGGLDPSDVACRVGCRNLCGGFNACFKLCVRNVC